MKYSQFIFDHFNFDKTSNTLSLHYSLDTELSFTETFIFDTAQFEYNEDALQKACWLLFLMAGVSYYKTYLPGEIIIKNNILDKDTAEFLSETWQEGLGEFFYVNDLDPYHKITFPHVDTLVNSANNIHDSSLLVGLGGGKDSIVTLESLRNADKRVKTWSLGHKQQLQKLVETTSVPHISVERSWDKKLLELNTQGAHNGHIPISAIFACAGAVLAVLSGSQDIIVSNEQSANEPTLTYQGKAINHQYSKSQQFERSFQSVLQNHFGNTIRYYSFLRPLSELHIAKIFAKRDFPTYKSVFSSCNRAFRHNSTELYWCGECPKCAFVCMILTPFTSEEDRLALWKGKNILTAPAMKAIYDQLLGIAGDKPLECIGEIEESRAAMDLASTTYPELSKEYSYELTEGYDYRFLRGHEMPDDMYKILKDTIVGLN